MGVLDTCDTAALLRVTVAGSLEEGGWVLELLGGSSLAGPVLFGSGAVWAGVVTTAALVSVTVLALMDESEHWVDALLSASELSVLGNSVSVESESESKLMSGPSPPREIAEEEIRWRELGGVCREGRRAGCHLTNTCRRPGRASISDCSRFALHDFSG